MDHFKNYVGVLVLAVISVGGFAAVVWQIVHGNPVDPLLATMVGGAIGTLSPSPFPAGKQVVEVDQGANNLVPVDPTAK